MPRQRFYVSNGPLAGNEYALDLPDGGEVLFKVDGVTHVYRAVIVWDTGREPDRFIDHIGVDPLV